MLDRSARDTIADVNAAVLVSLDFGRNGYLENLEELRQLATSDALTVLAVMKGKCSRPNPATYAGSGKVTEFALIL